MHALRTTFSPFLVGWVPFNQMGACVPQLLGNTLFSGIFPPTKLVKRYQPRLNLQSHRATCPAFQLLFMLRRGSLISMYVEFEQQEPSLQSSGAWEAIVLGATSTKKLIKAKSVKPISEDNVQHWIEWYSFRIFWNFLTYISGRNISQLDYDWLLFAPAAQTSKRKWMECSSFTLKASSPFDIVILI